MGNLKLMKITQKPKQEPKEEQKNIIAPKQSEIYANNGDNKDTFDKKSKKNSKDSKEYKMIPKIDEKNGDKIMNDLNFHFILKNDFDCIIISVKELSKNRIGILFENNLFLIINSKTFRKIYEIKINVPSSNNLDNNESKDIITNLKIKNFIELKNYDLVFWNKEKIFLYKLSEKEYILYQIINEFNNDIKDLNNQQTFEIIYSSNKNQFHINSVYQLKNGNLISYSSKGINIYSKKNDNYILLKDIDIDIEVKEIFELELNKLILMQHDIVCGTHFLYQSALHYDQTYSLSIYDIKNDTLYKLDGFKTNISLGNNEINFFNNDKYLFVKYGEFKFGIYDLNQMKSFNQNNEFVENNSLQFNYSSNRIKNEMNIIFICKYYRDLFFAKDTNNNIKIYRFKDKSFELYKDFAFSGRGIFKIKNNNLILFSETNIIKINNYE